MAGLEQKVLGTIKGKVGGIVGKVRNGKQYIASLPSHYTMSQAPHEVDKRNKFKVNGKFARAIKASDILYKIWDIEKAPATNAWNKICKVNFKLCNTDRPSLKNVITPDGFNLPVTNAAALPGGIEVDIESFNLQETESVVVFELLICFYNPVNEGTNYFELSRLTDYGIEDLKLTFNYSQQERQLAAAYKNIVIYLAAVTKNERGDIERWSQSYSKEVSQE
jgi:hypothetical protein